VAVVQATDARTEAEQLQAEAREARDAAVAAAEAAAAEAQSIAERKGALIEELARLEDVSVEIAEERQSALEAQALAEAAAEQQAAQEAAAAEQAAEQAEQDAADEVSQPAPEPAPAPEPEPQPEPAPQPPPAPPAPPAPSGGVGAAISFARAQIGEPYQWGAAGPSAWDCSGLTMGAWSAGGRSLPHYSVAQYEQSTPIGVGSLQPGDLLFWGSSSSPSSIYHVALYIGGGQMIHAPRTGRPVTQESMYYWTAPNFFARP
jgi:cell wall-associated NlpC family hydrolase